MPSGNSNVGYVGSCILDISGSQSLFVRVTQCDVNVKQDINKGDGVIDSKVDPTTYRIGPKIVGGNIAFPLIHEGSALPNAPSNPPCASSNATVAAELWNIATARDDTGRLANSFDLAVRYSDATAVTYPACYIESMAFAIDQQGPVNVTCEVFGTGVGASAPRLEQWGTFIQYNNSNFPGFLSPARIVQWNDVLLAIFGTNPASPEAGAVNFSCDGTQVQNVSFNVKNNLARVFTFNGSLQPQDIVAAQRDITGSFKFLGRNDQLADLAWTNETRYQSEAAIAFGYTLGGNANPYWATAFHSVIFNVETMAMTTGVFSTDVQWRAFGDCNNNYEGLEAGTTSGVINTNPGGYPSNGSFGGATVAPLTLPTFPSF